jgi:hypothetical protein
MLGFVAASAGPGTIVTRNVSSAVASKDLLLCMLISRIDVLQPVNNFLSVLEPNRLRVIAVKAIRL